MGEIAFTLYRDGKRIDIYADGMVQESKSRFGKHVRIVINRMPLLMRQQAQGNHP